MSKDTRRGEDEKDEKALLGRRTEANGVTDVV
jgi:hypothetical protein